MLFILHLILSNSTTQKTDDIRYIFMPNTSQPIKTLQQTLEFKDIIHAEFHNTDLTPSKVFQQDNAYNISQIRNRNKLIASLLAGEDTFYGIVDGRIIARDYVTFYSVFTDHEHRGRGHASSLLEYTVRKIKEKRGTTNYVSNLIGINQNTICKIFNNIKILIYSKGQSSITNLIKGILHVVFNSTLSQLETSLLNNKGVRREKGLSLILHLNPEDDMMNVNYAIYYSMGFRRGCVCEYGGPSYKHRLEEIYILKDVREAINDVETSKEKGFMFLMTCERLDRKKMDMKSLVEEGEVLRGRLLKKKKKEEESNKSK